MWMKLMETLDCGSSWDLEEARQKPPCPMIPLMQCPEQESRNSSQQETADGEEGIGRHWSLFGGDKNVL